MDICLDIENIIIEQIQDALVFVTDPMADGAHLEAIVISDEFKNQPLLLQHRRVMNILKNALNSNLHAIKLKTYTLEKWKQMNGGEI